MNQPSDISLRVTLAPGSKGDPLELVNPVMIAAGTGGIGSELAGWVDIGRLGAVVTGRLGRRGRRRAGEPRLVELPSGLLVAGEYQAVSYRRMLRDHGSAWRAWPAPVIANVAAIDPDECAAVADALEEAGVFAALELDFVGLDPAIVEMSEAATRVRAGIAAARSSWSGPLIAKLGYDRIAAPRLAVAARTAGADAISLGGGIPGMTVLTRRGAPPAVIRGRVVGPATRALALRVVPIVARAAGVPVIAAGGIATGGDAIDFLLCGATAVQVGSASFADPCAAVGVVDGIEAWLRAAGVRDIHAVIGAASNLVP